MAPVVTNGGVAIGTGLAASLTGVYVSIQYPWGEGTISLIGTATPTAGAAIVLPKFLVPAPGLYWNIYVESVPGNATPLLWGISYGGQVLITGLGIGQAPYAGNPTPGTAVLSDATTLTQWAFGITFAGVSAQTKVANVATVPNNSIANQIRIDPTGVYEFDTRPADLVHGRSVRQSCQGHRVPRFSVRPSPRYPASSWPSAASR